jgi:hypothetical protein
MQVHNWELTSSDPDGTQHFHSTENTRFRKSIYKHKTIHWVDGQETDDPEKMLAEPVVISTEELEVLGKIDGKTPALRIKPIEHTVKLYQKGLIDIVDHTAILTDSGKKALEDK